jgi:RNA polymerase-binding transcription factor DksA
MPVAGRFMDMSEFTNESVSAIETTLNGVDRALERLRLGTYRSCQVCGTPIDDADLEAKPLLANCRTHPELA